ncbi:MAG: phage minor head protein [Shewanella sp.]
MKYDLRALLKQSGFRRKSFIMRSINPPQFMAGELTGATLEVARHWERAKPVIMAEYARTLSQLTTDRPADVEREVNSAGVIGAAISLLITPRIMQWINRVERWHRGKWIANVPSNVNLTTLLFSGDVSETLETILARNVALVKDISLQTQGKIADIVFRGLQARTPARRVAKEISEATGFARKRTLGIASDQLQKLTSALDADRMRQAGLEEYEWQHSGKVHFRVNHKARDGQKYKIGEPKGDEPGFKPYCGCKRRPVLDLE